MQVGGYTGLAKYGYSSGGLGQTAAGVTAGGGTYRLKRFTRVEQWMQMGKSVGVGFAARAHPGVYLEVDWKGFNAMIARQLALGYVAARKGILETGRLLYEKIKERNPVKTGLSKAAWELRTKGLANKTAPFVEIANQVFYTIKLEFGSSRKAPQGMVRVSMKEMTGVPARLIAAQLAIERKKFLGASAGIGARGFSTFKLTMGPGGF